MTRRLLLNLTLLDADDVARFRETLRSLLAGHGSKPRIEPRRSCLRMTAVQGGDTIDIEYDVLPRGMRRRAAARLHHRQLQDLPRDMATMMLDPSTIWFHEDADESSPWTNRWEGWIDLQLVGEALVPDFLERMPSATDGSPWATAECLPQFDGGGPVLPHALVEHVFSPHPHVLNVRRDDDANVAFRSWTIACDRPLGFEAVDADPIRTMRLLATIPPALLEGIVR